MRGRRKSAVLVALGLAASGCRGGRAGPPPERFLPASVRLALVVPETGRAARELGAVHAALAEFPFAAELAGARGALAAQLGFDPLDPEALADAGVDPRRGAALAQVERPGGRDALLVLPVKDAPKLEALFARLARERLGAPEREAEVHGAVPVVILRRARGGPAALAYAVTERTALLAAGPGGPAAVVAALALAPAGSLAESAAWRTARRALGDGPAAVAFAPPGSSALAGLWPARDGIAVGASAGADGVRLAAALLLGDREPSFRALAARGAAAGALARLDPGATVAVRFDGDLAALGAKLAPLLPAADRARLAARGLDPRRDLFDLLAPGAAAVLSLAPDLDFAGLSEEALREDPLRLARFEAVLPLRDAAAARAVSERLVRRPPPPGRHARPAPAPAPPGDGPWRIRTGSGEIAWTVDAAGRLVAAGGPPGALDALLARLAGGGAGFHPPTPHAAAVLEGGLGGAVLDPQRLVASVRALPDEAFGSGPSGFVVRSVVDRFVDPAARLAAVSLRADLAEGALVVALEVEARAAGARP